MANRRLSFTLTFAATIAVLLGIVVLLNAVLNRVDLGRFDLTDDHVYTMSPAAKRVLGDLQVPVQLKFYITAREEMPTGLQTLERDVVDKLAEYRVASGGNLSFAVYDPSKDEELAEKIAAKNIRPFQVQSIERDAMGIKLVYSAIEIAYLDKEPETIPQVLPQSLDTLEYDICSAVTRLVRDMDPVVAVYASRMTLDPQLMQMYLQMGQTPPEPQDMFTQVSELLKRENYDVRRVEITEESPIPEEASTLLVLFPRGLDERQRYEINRFVQLGGNVLFAIQQYEYNYDPARRGGFNVSAQRVETGLEPLLSSYGVTVSDALFMDSNMEVLGIPRTQSLGGLQLQMTEPVQLPIQIRVGEGQLNEDISVTSRLGQLLYLWGSRLVIDEPTVQEKGLTLTPLFHSSSQSWEVDPPAGPLGPSDLLPDPDHNLGGSPLAVMLQGELPDVFEQGMVPPWRGAEPDTTGAQPSPVEEFVPVSSKAMVVASGKMFDDGILGAAGNSLFLLNAVDALTLGDDLIQIRAKAFTRRTIEQVSDSSKLLYRFFAIGLVPILVAAFGILRMVRRRQEQAAFLAAHEG